MNERWIKTSHNLLLTFNNLWYGNHRSRRVLENPTAFSEDSSLSNTPFHANAHASLIIIESWPKNLMPCVFMYTLLMGYEASKLGQSSTILRRFCRVHFLNLIKYVNRPQQTALLARWVIIKREWVGLRPSDKSGQNQFSFHFISRCYWQASG